MVARTPGSAGGRSPRQARGVETVERAVATTVELLDEVGPSEVRFALVTERAGISNGSLLHHFGSLGGLLSAAEAVRYEAAVSTRLAAARELVVASGDVAALQSVVARTAQAVAAGAFDELRWMRLSALSFARHRPELQEVLGDTIGRLRDEIAVLFAGLLERGMIRYDVPAGAATAFVHAHTVGRLVEDIVDDRLPPEQWVSLLDVAVRGGFGIATASFAPVLPPEEADTVEPLPPEVPGLLRAHGFDPSEDADERRVFEAARLRFMAEGEQGVVVADLLRELDVSNGWFVRRFHGRDELVDLLHLDAYLRMRDLETAALVAAFRGAEQPRDLVATLVGRLEGLEVDAAWERWWDRLDLLVAANERSSLRTVVAPLITEQLAAIADAVEAAQARGVVRDDLAAQAVARFLWGIPVAILVAAIGGIPTRELRTFSVALCSALVRDPEA